MTRLSKCFALLILALWVPATVHCDVEHVTGLDFLAWCHSADAVPQQGDGCAGDACSVVESGLYKVEEQAASVPVPLLVLSFVAPLWETAPPTATAYPEVANSSPPEFARAWQFSYRTALPPRAPSLVA